MGKEFGLVKVIDCKQGKNTYLHNILNGSQDLVLKPFHLLSVNESTGIKLNPTYEISLDTIFGFVLVTNIIGKNFDFIPEKLYNLNWSVQDFYRVLLVHHTHKRTIRYSLDEIMSHMRYTNRYNATRYIEKNIRELLNSGLIKECSKSKIEMVYSFKKTSYSEWKTLNLQ